MRESLRESQRYTKGMFSWIGFKKKELLFDQQDRVAGESKWSFFKLLNLAVEGITSFKIKPENIKVLMSRAIALYDMKKVKEALVDYDTIIRLDSNYIFAYYNRSLIRSEIGDYNGAITDLDRVIDLNPDNILVYFNRALSDED